MQKESGNELVKITGLGVGEMGFNSGWAFYQVNDLGQFTCAFYV